MVVADAGHNQALTVGDTAHFEFSPNRTLKVEAGEPPHLEVAYEWTTDRSDPISSNETFSVTSTTPALLLVALNITAEKTTASDVAAVLFAPSTASSDRRLDLAFVGDIHIGGLSSADVVKDYVVAGHEAQSIEKPLGASNQTMSFAMVPAEDSILEPTVHGSLLISVKDGVGPARTVATEPAAFATNSTFSLNVDTSPAAHHTVTIAAPGKANETVALETFVHDHPAEEAVEVPILESQTLPGFEAAAAVAVTGALGVAMASLRRRS